jgi:hypothetical protein
MTTKTHKPLTRARKVVLVARARLHGAHYAWRIIDEADKAGIGPALALAMVEQETRDFSNVFGHDDSIFRGAGRVTEEKYKAYLRARNASGHPPRAMQGVGLMQLTWYQLQDEADRLGGCWRIRPPLRVAFLHLRSLINANGLQDGIARYNGSGRETQAYARAVLARRDTWRKRLGIKTHH